MDLPLSLSVILMKNAYLEELPETCVLYPISKPYYVAAP
jgi:hypothetical protein